MVVSQRESLQFLMWSQKVPLITQSLLPTTTPTHIIHASFILESEHILGRISPDDDEIDDHLNDSFSPWLNRFPDENPLSKINISGDKDLQSTIRSLCNEYRCIFSDVLPEEPAKKAGGKK